MLLLVCLSCKPTTPKTPEPTTPKETTSTKTQIDYWKCGEGPTLMLEAEGPLRLLVADETGLYWVELQTKNGKTQSRVMYLPAKENRVVELSRDNGIIRSLAIEKDFLYWLSDYNLMRYSKEESKAGVMSELGDTQAFSLVQDSKKLYWVSGKGDKIYSISKSGGEPQVVATGSGISSIAIDGDVLYWVSSGTEKSDFKDGSLNKLEFTKSKPSKVLEKIGNPSAIKADQAALYWSMDSEIWSTSKGKAKAKQLNVESGNLNTFLVDEGFLYGANISDNNIWKYNKATSEKTVLASISDLYDISLYNERLFWSQNGKGDSGPLSAKGRLYSLCQRSAP